MAELEKIMAGVADRMRADLAAARTTFVHSGLKGSANEEGVREMLRQYLPGSLDVSTGTIMDSTGRQSRQLDVVLSDSARTPVFFEAGGARVIPAECAIAVVEVKAQLTKEELRRSYENMKSVKEMEKRAYFKAKGVTYEEHTLYGRAWSYWPTLFFILAYESAMLPGLKSELDALQQEDPVESRIDMICSLERGVIMNQEPDGKYSKYSALPSPGSQTVALDTDNSLLLFYTMISIVLNQAKVPVFNVRPYIVGVVFG